ncbi:MULTISPECIES: ATP-binding protein [unclassified Pseudomonas]|jgi:hypothetical protein|uniref:ATP-binding protein n=1 Tax=unclassified Pseudomonas TaxID=196821 RepID=UPI0002726DD5|nr:MULTISPECIES: ATP-binding protein [unclassified Pseudomonas]EJL99289.1 hypothetical protein PMI19_04145 [Pseudomonas sp. GM16]EJM31074.1 hypothetical protein PMI23_04538 [Pseudomonas sp. GM24]
MEIKNLRPLSKEAHPVALRTYLLPTQAIDLIYAMVMKVINRKDTGLLVYGNTRYGKTRSIYYCTKMLQIEFPGVPVRLFSVHLDLAASEGKFFTLFLEAVKHADTGGSVADKRIRLANYIIDAGKQNPRRIFILFIDEAQKLWAVHYEWLRDIYDQAEIGGVSLLVILVGQLDLYTQKKTLIKNKKGEIVSRFMTFDMQFYGIRTYEDFASCLSQYDTLEFPAGSNWTFTRFFLPTAYASGFRLGANAQVLWDAFLKQDEELGINDGPEIPMKYFTKTVEIFLEEHPEFDLPNFNLTPDICRGLIVESWYPVFMEHLKDMSYRT